MEGLKLKKGAEEVIRGFNEISRQPEDKRSLAKPASKGNILILDDQIVIATILKYSLEKNNFNIIGLAQSGEEAIQMFKKNQPEIILVDISLEGNITGIETVARIQAQFYDVPHIYITSSREDETYKLAKSTRPFGYINKPFNESELIRSVELAIDKAQIEKKLRLKNISLSLAYEEIHRQKKEITKKNKDITDSINYAKKIMEAVLPTRHQFYDILPNSFIMESPKDIIGGDFFWYHKSGDKVITAAIDCTGHGVPGALIAISSNNFLNEIVKEKQIVDPSMILNELNKYIVSTFREGKNEELETKNGLDIALCVIDQEKKEFLYAGAYRPLLYFKQNKLHVVKGENFPIGRKLKKTEKFTTTSIKISEGDTFYMFTDGYTDQFGGADNKKYSKRRFQNLLESIQSLEIFVHGNVLKYSFEQWKEQHEQVDDILVIGMRF